MENNHKKNKISVYLPNDLLEQLNEEKIRLDRSSSWLIQRAWKIAFQEIKKMPSLNQEIDT